MYVSRLSFRTLPGKTGETEKELRKLRKMVADAGGIQPRILHTHFASPGAPDIVFEQETRDLAQLEAEMSTLTAGSEFQSWTSRVSALLSESPKREIYLISG
ncbi:MAG: hypothetical protein IVW54_03040 [Candidatus Binataceae bacterium]|nr:hypothetical protein [Candidatus Binataceae bacterium]